MNRGEIDDVNNEKIYKEYFFYYVHQNRKKMEILSLMIEEVEEI